MATKVQFNASTLKASWDSDNSRVQVDTNYVDTIILANVVDCDCETAWGSDVNGTYSNFRYYITNLNYFASIDDSSNTDWKVIVRVGRNGTAYEGYVSIIVAPASSSHQAFLSSDLWTNSSPVGNYKIVGGCCDGGQIGYDGTATWSVLGWPD